MLCPKCHAPIDLTTGICDTQHQFPFENGVLCLLDDALRPRLDTIYQHRDKVTAHLPMIVDYNRLPYALADQHFEWRLRAYDAGLVLRNLKNQHTSLVTCHAPLALEIGAWNGWLTHLLARDGYRVTAIDYFAHETDGLGAKSRYDAHWQAIQMDITDLSLFDERFEAIIVNYGLHFFPDPVAYLGQLRRLLAPNGILIGIGLAFYRDARERMEQVRQLESLFIKPTRGYLDMRDYAAMQAQGLQLRRDLRLWRAHLKAAITPSAPLYRYGVAYALA